MKIAVLAGAGVVPPIEIVGKIKGAEVYGILMDYTALCVIFILYIDLTLEILNRTEIPVAVIRISPLQTPYPLSGFPRKPHPPMSHWQEIFPYPLLHR